MSNELTAANPLTDMDGAKDMARIMSASSLMPQEYRGEKGRANCMIALEMAHRIGASPMMVAQNLNIIHGRPSWSSAFMIACINASGRFSKPLRYEECGEMGADSWGMRAVTADEQGEEIRGPWVTITMAKAEGWASKNGSKWKTMPEVMLRYRAASMFARTVCPELTMGISTEEEARDIGALESTPVLDGEPTPIRVINGEAESEPAPEQSADDFVRDLGPVDGVDPQTGEVVSEDVPQ